MANTSVNVFRIKIPILFLLTSLAVIVLITLFWNDFWIYGMLFYAACVTINCAFIYRSSKIYRLRSEILNNFGTGAVAIMPEYDTMLKHMWIPVSKYKKDILLKAGILSGIMGDKNDDNNSEKNN